MNQYIQAFAAAVHAIGSLPVTHVMALMFGMFALTIAWIVDRLSRH